MLRDTKALLLCEYALRQLRSIADCTLGPHIVKHNYGGPGWT